ncbi:MAG: sulfite exporter TauE/SafE family protein [Eubacterium sp.]|jgi:uncharacterized membrane protein YfcA|nr:sulfite exporter TauE/SafE family protein [Eubacterium sp.]
MKKHIKIIAGLLCGGLNGLFGSGGGVIAVPMLEKSGIKAKQSHATSVTLIFFLSLISTAVYALGGELDYKTAFEYIPWGITGAIPGSFLLKKIPNSLLRRIFGVVMVISAIRILVK